MTFDCVGKKPNGEPYMKFHKPFNTLEKIQLLERWILVQSFVYYELNDNLVTDFMYDSNAKQLAELKKQCPEDFKNSRYYDYFYDYCSEEDGTVNTSGFDLLQRVKKLDPEMYRRMHIDAVWALDLKQRRGVEG